MTRAANPTVESDQEVAALLIAAKPKAAPVYRWRCCRCANPQESDARPPSPQLCARCRSIRLDMHTEPATRPVYGDESEDDGAPPEHIQPDTPPSEATATATKEAVPVTMTAAPTLKTLPEPWKCTHEGCDFRALTSQSRGVHLKKIHGVAGASNGARSFAAKQKATPRPERAPAPRHICPECGKAFGTGSALDGHRNTHTSAKAKRQAEVSKAPFAKLGSVVDRAENGDKAAQAELARPETFFDEAGAPPSDFAALGRTVGELVATKQAAYGDSFGRSGAVLRILYPIGIAPEQYDDALAVVRVVDKLFRVATDRDALGESPWKDIAGYGLLGAARTEKAAK